MTIKPIANFPRLVQEAICDHLKAFDECNVTFQNGDWIVGGGNCLLGTYPKDYKCYAPVKASDIYTDKEREQNYLLTFNAYPPDYSGKKDWTLLHRYEELKKELLRVERELTAE